MVELLEKRVKSRFSHRQIQLFPDYTFEEYKQLVVSLLHVPNNAYIDRDYCKIWNEHLKVCSPHELLADISTSVVALWS